MTPTLLYISIFSGIILISYIVLWVLFIRQKNAWKSFMTSPLGDGIDSTISALKSDLSSIHTHEKITDQALEDLDTRLGDSIRGVGMVRYNAFSDTAGNQSFAIAMLSETGDGLIISSIYSRTRTSIYTRNITEFTTNQELTVEESQSLAQAKTNLSK